MHVNATDIISKKLLRCNYFGAIVERSFKNEEMSG